MSFANMMEHLVTIWVIFKLVLVQRQDVTFWDILKIAKGVFSFSKALGMFLYYLHLKEVEYVNRCFTHNDKSYDACILKFNKCLLVVINLPILYSAYLLVHLFFKDDNHEFLIEKDFLAKDKFHYESHWLWLIASLILIKFFRYIKKNHWGQIQKILDIIYYTDIIKGKSRNQIM